MTHQTISQLFLLIGIVLTGIGGYCSYHFGKKEAIQKETQNRKEQESLKKEISSLHAMTTEMYKKTDLIYQNANIKEEVWMELEMKHVPPGVTDYLLLLFVSDKGRISGKARIKGSNDVTSFSTTANNRIPVVLRNLWVSEKNQYKIPTIMEFTITEKTEPDASLSIYTQGWIDTAGTEPH
jgi:hypothetical protein